ncbi:pyroglutamyl-peptidase I [Alkalicoccobacillus murimartini]|uniref:Pyroglutamyl-peptidase I n=1 Tax=Alkalicoccobacillus murimartini TaxID=171685 RepID=A0ABT9YG10_9BACI|nr:pyroglutamyl-peptidase I [Alkalicoccobacillus murimartini]MDQ0206777.1 pyroglutamyl-peptidase [Alkalicoccobacillus murimartini]
MMKTLLLTGFEAFLQHKSNPTERIATQLNGESIGGFTIVGKVLPVSFKESAEILLDFEKEVKPDAVMMLGLAAGRASITPERIAINIQGGDVDNKGVKLKDEPIIKQGPDGYMTTLPIHDFVEALHSHQIPAAISNTAGTYLCNKVMYSMLHACKQRGIALPAGFVHIPYSHDMCLTNPMNPSLSYETMEEAVRIMIKQLT